MPDFHPLQQLADQIILFLPNLLGSIVIFIGFWIASTIVSRLITSVGNHTRADIIVRKMLADGAKVAILIVGMLTALGTLGIDVTAMVAGLGLTSLALGLALKDIVSNVVSGVLILMYHPFRIGDTVDITGSAGVVINIDLRYTTLQGDNKVIMIPNQNVFSNTVTVHRARRSPETPA
ncbi:MAG: mechanosensitive ion channel domain-containing protein [Chloroflexota bacterium]